MFGKYFLALFATLFIGPGIGHLFLKKYKKAFILIGLALTTVLLSAVILLSSIDISTLPQTYNAMREYLKNALAQNAGKMMIVDVPLAAIWAYAFADIVFAMATEYKTHKKNEQTEK